MAMLGLNDVFQKVWGEHIAETRPYTEFWEEVIPEVKKIAPNFIFIAEVYWDMDWPLQQIGFDFTYDKRLYDRMFFDSAISVGEHLNAEPVYRDKCLRFIENHDEERATVTFGKQKSRAAGIIAATVPGLRFFYDGQLEGRRIRIVVRDVPAIVCSQCGADWFQDLVASKLENIVNDAREKHLTVEVTTLSA